MALSPYGWLIGIIALSSVSFSTLFGIWIIIKSRKLQAKLLKYMGLVIISLGAAYLGVCVDFFTVLLTGNNMNHKMQAFLSYAPSAGGLYLSIVIYCDLTFTKKKKYILYPVLLVAIIYTFIVILTLFAPINLFISRYPGKPGEELIQTGVNLNSPFIILFAFGLIPFIYFCCFGYLYNAINSVDILRRKFFYLFSGYTLFNIGVISEMFLSPGIFVVLVRISVFLSVVFFYLGVREEPEKKEKIKPDKEVRVEGDLFRISQIKREDITEEEVSISKEKKICLVCKGKVLGYNVFICRKCETFYCEKCARALENIENACWACNAPIDESRPVKPFKREGNVTEAEKIMKGKGE